MFDVSPSTPGAYSDPIHRWQTAQEMIFTLAAGSLLLWLAQALADPVLAGGRNGIYLQAESGSATAHAYWLQTHVGTLLLAWSALGTLVLMVGRAALPTAGKLCASAVLWLLAWGTLQQTWQGDALWRVADFNAWWVLAGLAFLLWPVLTRLVAYLAGPGQTHPAQILRSVWVYPGFILLSGLSVLWLLDYAARGPQPKHLLGYKQLQTWLGAVVIYTVIAGVRPAMLGTLAWVLSRIDKRSGEAVAQQAAPSLRWSVAVLTTLAMGTVIVCGSRGLLKPAVTNELLRAPLYLVGGWMLYRWQGAAARNGWHMNIRLISRLLLVAGVPLLALAVLGDKGPMLILAYSGAIILSLLALQAVMGPRPRSSILVAILLSSCLVWGLHAALVNLIAPWTDTLNTRLQALQILHDLPDATLWQEQLNITAPTTPLDFLQRLHWFMQSAGVWGHGLGHTPWCGYSGNLGAACEAWVGSRHEFKDNGAGVPWQTASDYGYAGLTGVWGPILAALALVLLVSWLWRLLPRRTDLQTQGVVSMDALGLSMVALFAVTTLVQTAITVLGTLAITPMTGVTLPLLSYGTSSLWVCAFFGGVGAHVLRSPRRHARQRT